MRARVVLGLALSAVLMIGTQTMVQQQCVEVAAGARVGDEITQVVGGSLLLC